MTTNPNRDWAADQQGTYEHDVLKREASKLNANVVCKGKNCTAINGINHSPECIAHHEACYEVKS